MLAWPTIVCGALLVVDGLVGYFQSEKTPPSPTALIPAFFGGVLILCGVLSFKESLRKHVMHFAAILGVVGVIGGFMPLMRQTDSFDPKKPSAIAGEVMILVCAVFVGLCVKSFIDARKARKAKMS